MKKKFEESRLMHDLLRDWKRWSWGERAAALALLAAFAAFQASLVL